MADSVYKVIELVGTSTDSWEKAAAAAVNNGLSNRSVTSGSPRSSSSDMTLEDGKVATYRAKVKLSFKYEGGA